VVSAKYCGEADRRICPEVVLITGILSPYMEPLFMAVKRENRE
jgi:hypothetical protein